jgi:hypothetical protein
VQALDSRLLEVAFHGAQCHLKPETMIGNRQKEISASPSHPKENCNRINTSRPSHKTPFVNPHTPSQPTKDEKLCF